VIDARLLVEAASGASRTEILADPHRTLTPAQAQALDDMVARRVRREPVSHILGRKGFWKILLKVTPDVLTPRPETETILDVVLPAMDEASPLRLLDLGVGSGAIALAILAERPAAKALGVDASEAALAVARENAANLGLAGRLALLRGDWTVGLAEASFDVVVANPPYVRSADIAGLEPEVRDHEPRLALDGGADGLDAYRSLAPQILHVLTPGGLFALEVGLGQAAEVRALMQAAGAEGVGVRDDLSGRPRVVFGRRRAAGGVVEARKALDKSAGDNY
jgi:release factor glutamine methyltransferase